MNLTNLKQLLNEEATSEKLTKFHQNLFWIFHDDGSGKTQKQLAEEYSIDKLFADLTTDELCLARSLMSYALDSLVKHRNTTKNKTDSLDTILFRLSHI